ncbi:MAG: hypothetical protein OXF84_04845 [Bacteroidetes bacterium]|nr:hypothetical protein [Bacteroidota bacterium]
MLSDSLKSVRDALILSLFSDGCSGDRVFSASISAGERSRKTGLENGVRNRWRHGNRRVGVH